MATSCITIFGLAHDATDREVHVLFSGCPGYVQCKLVPNKDHTQRPFAFVQFETPDEAVHATTSRSGTVWDVGMYPIAIEISKRNMPGVAEGAGGQPPQAVRPPPARVPAQQGQFARPSAYGHSALQSGQPAPSSVPTVWRQAAATGQEPAPKRPRSEVVSVPPDGKRTIHVGGLPNAFGQQEFQGWIQSLFPTTFVGGRHNAAANWEFSRGFAAFASHQDAKDALWDLDGSEMEGAVLRAEWARSEWFPWEGVPRQEAAAPQQPERVQPMSFASVVAKQGVGRRTLHFVNLPPVSREEFDEFVAATFPNQVECTNFKDAGDGRPPVAWLLFVDCSIAAQIADTYRNFDWCDVEVGVQYARSELDPSKYRR